MVAKNVVLASLVVDQVNYSSTGKFLKKSLQKIKNWNMPFLSVVNPWEFVHREIQIKKAPFKAS